jgi:hypothetical protein
MKKQNIDKTKQQFKLDDIVFVVSQRNNVPCLTEGKICGIFKHAEEENAEVNYHINDLSANKEMPNTCFSVTYDNVFKDLEIAQQKVMDSISLNYNNMRENITNTINAIKTDKNFPKRGEIETDESAVESN